MEVVLGNPLVAQAVQSRGVPGVISKLLVPAVSAQSVGKAAMDALMGPIPSQGDGGPGQDLDDGRVIDLFEILRRK